MKFSNKSFFSKCDQIDRKLRIWSHLLKKFLMKTSCFAQGNLNLHWFVGLEISLVSLSIDSSNLLLDIKESVV